MQKPSLLLAEIIEIANAVLSEDSLNSQQATFVRHIYNTAQELHSIAAAIPPTDYAIRTIVPVLGDTFFKPQYVPGERGHLSSCIWNLGFFSGRCTGESLPLRVDFIHRVEFGEVSGHRVLIKRGPGNRSEEHT